MYVSHIAVSGNGSLVTGLQILLNSVFYFVLMFLKMA